MAQRSTGRYLKSRTTKGLLQCNETTFVGRVRGGS
jgi:hypothetical protein